MTEENKKLYYKLMNDCGDLIEDCPNEKAGKRVLACEYCRCDFLVKKTAKEILDELYHKNYEIEVKIEDYELHEKAIEIVSKAMLKALNERIKSVAERYGVEVE